MPKQKCYAVAVRDNAHLFLFITVCRGSSGDVYVNFPREQTPDWKPHTSHHASGQRHHKSYGHKFGVVKGQQPDANFGASENLVTTGIALDDVRAINTPCDPLAYEDVFEIAARELRPKYASKISVELTAADGKMIITPGDAIVRSTAYKDFVPWISRCLRHRIDTRNGKAESE